MVVSAEKMETLSMGCICGRPQLVNAVLEELDGACEEPGAEVERLRRLQRIYSTSSSRSCTICLEEGKLLGMHACAVKIGHHFCGNPLAADQSS